MRFGFGAASALATGTFAAASLVTLRLGFAATDFGLAARALGAVPSGTGSAGGVSATAGLGASETGEAGASAATGAGAALRLGFLAAGLDRKNVLAGKGGSVRGDSGCPRDLETKKQPRSTRKN